MDVFSGFHGSKSTKKVSEALKKQLMLDIPEELESEGAWMYPYAAAKRRRINDDGMQIE